MNELYENLATDYGDAVDDDSYDESIFDEARRRRPRGRPVNVRPGSGVTSGVVNTPRGSATVELPKEVVSQEEFKKAVEQLQGAINKNAASLNALSDESARTRASIAKLRKEMADNTMMTSMMGMMQMNALKSKFNDHTHGAANQKVEESQKMESNAMMMMMPMMMMGMGGEGGSNNDGMMMAMMMMAMGGK